MHDREAFAASWTAAVAANGQLRRWNRYFFSMPAKVAALYPKDVACIVGAQVLFDRGRDTAVLVANTLSLDGYDLESSRSHWKKFRDKFPDFNPATAMLCSSEQLVEKYGTIWGRMLTDLLLHPESQPFMYQLFFGDLQTGDSVKYRLAQRRCWDITWAMSVAMDGTGTPDESTASEWQERGSKLLDPHTADFTHRRVTGGRRLNLTVAVFDDAMPIYPTKE